MLVQQRVGKTAVAVSLLVLVGCANMDSQEQRMVSGGAVGVGAGYVIDQMDKHP